MHDDESKVGKFIVFKMADYLLALPIGDVLKVVNSSVTSQGLRTMGVIQIGRHMIKVLDLLPPSRKTSSPQLPRNPPFLVITRGPQGELCGISVDEPPDLIELPLEMIQSVPLSSSVSRVFEMVSHAAVVSQEGVTTTIFLLDVKRTLKPVINDVPSRLLRPS